MILLFESDKFSNKYTHTTVHKIHLDLTKMVQHIYVYDADNMFENVNSVTFRLFLINTVQIVPLATFQQRCIVRYMQY